MPKSIPVPFLENDQEVNQALSKNKILNEKETQSMTKVRSSLLNFIKRFLIAGYFRIFISTQKVSGNMTENEVEIDDIDSRDRRTRVSAPYSCPRCLKNKVFMKKYFLIQISGLLQKFSFLIT